jgi:hypothetical protein
MDVAYSDAQLAGRVFETLKRQGPLCESQLSVELLEGPGPILLALRELSGTGLVEKRPDENPRYQSAEVPWGLKRPRFLFKKK